MMMLKHRPRYDEEPAAKFIITPSIGKPIKINAKAYNECKHFEMSREVVQLSCDVRQVSAKSRQSGMRLNHT